MAARPAGTPLEPRRVPLDPSLAKANAPVLTIALVVFFLAAVGCARFLRPELLLDGEPAWAVPRAFLWLCVLSIAASAGLAAAALVSGLSRPGIGFAPARLPFARRSRVLLLAAALIGGVLARAVWIDRLPWALWVDDTSLVRGALALRGADLGHLVRKAPELSGAPTGSVGVLYLYVLRGFFEVCGTSALGIRLPSLLGGCLSLLTAAWLGWRLLPRGGGVIAALILGGLRWSLIESRWGWVTVLLAPVLDVAAILMVRARRRASPGAALASGLVAGLGTHLYLAAWVGAASLGLFAIWKPADPQRPRRPFALALCFALGFAAMSLPLLLPPLGDGATYFSRVAGYRSWPEAFGRQAPAAVVGMAADAVMAPWLPDPLARHDIPGRPRLGLVVGVLLALGLLRGLMRPRQESSAFLLAQAAAAVGAACVWGPAGHPNGFRFGYLATAVAVGAASGALCVLGLFRDGRRRVPALALIGLIVVSGGLAARDTLVTWAESRDTFDGFLGRDTLVGRAAARWARVGSTTIDEGSFRPTPSFVPMIEMVGESRLEPRDAGYAALAERAIAVRIVAPDTAAAPGERVVERIVDGWGRHWADALARRTAAPAAILAESPSGRRPSTKS